MRQSILQRVDEALVVWANNSARRSAWTRALVSSLARWLALVEVGLMLMLGLGGRRRSALRMLGTVGLVYVACDVLGMAWPRQRPFARLSGVELLLPHDAERAFPSRHVASGVAMAAIGGQAHPRLGVAMTLVACALGISRVAAGLHYPSDIIGGAALGRLIAACFARYR